MNPCTCRLRIEGHPCLMNPPRAESASAWLVITERTSFVLSICSLRERDMEKKKASDASRDYCQLVPKNPLESAAGVCTHPFL